MPQPAAVMPCPAIEPVSPGCNGDLPVSAAKCRDNGDHLILPQTGLRGELVVAHTGVGFSHAHDPVQHIVAVVPAIEGEVILFQLIRQGGQDHAVLPLAQHGQHTGPPGGKPDAVAQGQAFQDQGHQVIQRIYFFRQGIHCH